MRPCHASLDFINQISHSGRSFGPSLRVYKAVQRWVKAAMFCFVALCMGQGPMRAHCQESSHRKSGETEETKLIKEAQLEPRNLQAVGALGEFYFKHQQWRKSVEWLGEAYSLSEKDGAIGCDLAYAMTQSGDLDTAKSLLLEIEKRKDSAKVHSLLAEVEERKGELVDAAAEFHRAAELDASEANIFDLASFLLQHKEYVGALNDSIKFFRYGVAQFPNSARMMVGLGVALYANSQYDEAVRTLCSAVDLDPKDQRAVQFLGRASKVSPELAGEVNRRLKDFAERYPKSAVTNYFYALNLWEHGGGEQGENRATIERLLKNSEALSPTWYEPHYQLGVLYQSEERIQDAIREIKLAVKIDPDFFPAHYRLANLYSRVGEKVNAAKEAELVRVLKAKDNEGTLVHDVSE